MANYRKPKLTPQEKNRLRIKASQDRLEEKILSGEYRPKSISGFKKQVFHTEKVVATHSTVTETTIRMVKVTKPKFDKFVKRK